MKKKNLFWSIIPVICTTITAQSSVNVPNIVFILADDMGWKDLHCYGNTFNETPNIDSLANSGIQFSQAYSASPVSSPTRASILTGKHPAQLKITNFMGGFRSDPNSPCLPAFTQQELKNSEVTIAELLKSKGYTTAMVGKWHLGERDSVAPWMQGFDFTRMIGKNGLNYYNYSIYMDSYKNEFVDHGTDYLTDKLTEYGVQFIKSNKEKPFFLYLAYSAPHVMIIPKPEKIAKYMMKYEADKQHASNPYYAAMVESLDEGIGKIVQTLKNAGLLDNTLIVFTSDNGGVGTNELGPTPTSMAPLRKWKGFVYEGGIRVPAIMSWKDKIPTHSNSEHYFSTTDYLPTMAEIAGINKLPDSLSGKSLLPIMLHPENRINQNDTLFWHYPHFSNQGGRPSSAVRCSDYKLIENLETNQVELFNLKNDICELHDLSSELKYKSLIMKNMLYEWRKKHKVEMPIPNPDFKNIK